MPNENESLAVRSHARQHMTVETARGVCAELRSYAMNECQNQRVRGLLMALLDDVAPPDAPPPIDATRSRQEQIAMHHNPKPWPNGGGISYDPCDECGESVARCNLEKDCSCPCGER